MDIWETKEGKEREKRGREKEEERGEGEGGRERERGKEREGVSERRETYSECLNAQFLLLVLSGRGFHL